MKQLDCRHRLHLLIAERNVALQAGREVVFCCRNIKNSAAKKIKINCFTVVLAYFILF